MRETVAPAGAAPEEVRAADEAPLGADRLLPLVYDELRALAARKLACEKPGHKLDGHALVHEAYLRLVGPRCAPRLYRGRRHFLAAAATAMRRILIDHARRELTRRHSGPGGGAGDEALEAVAAPEPDEELLALAEALRKLAAREPQKVRLVELRYFGGLTGEQARRGPGHLPDHRRPPLGLRPRVAPGRDSRRPLTGPERRALGKTAAPGGAAAARFSLGMMCGS